MHPYTSSRKSSYGEDYYFYKSREEYSYINALKQVDFHICPFVDLDKKDQLFFEIGCGMGYVQDILKHKYKNLDIYGMEISEYAGNFAQEQFGVKMSIGAFEKLPFADNYFDVIYNGGVLEHVEDPYILLRKVYAILKKGGTLITTVPNYGSIYRKLNSNWKNLNIFHLFYYSEKNIGILLKKVGFKINTIDVQHLNVISRFGLFRLGVTKFTDKPWKTALSNEFKDAVYQSDYKYLNSYLKKHIGLYDENVDKSILTLLLNCHLNKLLKNRSMGDTLIIIATK